MVCRLLAGGRWIRTSSTRARSIWLSALLGGLCFAIGCGSGRGASGTARYQRRGWAILASRPRGGPPHGSIDQGNVFRVEHRVAGAMAPDRRDRPPFGLLHAGDLAPVVFDGEIEIGLTRHHGRVGGDCTQCFIEVAAASSLALLSACGCQVHSIANRSLASRRRKLASQLSIRKSSSEEKPILRQILLAIERLAQPPAGTDGAHRLEAARRRGGEPAVRPNRTGGQRRLDAFEKNEIVSRGIGRTADRRDPARPCRGTVPPNGRPAVPPSRSRKPARPVHLAPHYFHAARNARRTDGHPAAGDSLEEGSGPVRSHDVLALPIARRSSPVCAFR